MNNLFGTNGVEDKVFESKYIQPGINDVKIVNFEANDSLNSLRINFTHLTKTYTDNGTKMPLALTVDLGFTEKSAPYQNRKIKHLSNAIVTAQETDATLGSISSLADYAAKLNALLGGKPVRIKFVGKEVAGKDGKKNWVKAELGLPTFAEKITVPAADTKLVYDETSKYDFQRLAPKTNEDALTATSGTGLPF